MSKLQPKMLSTGVVTVIKNGHVHVFPQQYPFCYHVKNVKKQIKKL